MGLDPFPRRRVECVLAWRWQMCKCVLADYNMRSSPRPTDLVMLSSTIVRGAPRYQIHIPWTGSRDGGGRVTIRPQERCGETLLLFLLVPRAVVLYSRFFVVTGATTSSSPRAGDICLRAMSQNSVQSLGNRLPAASTHGPPHLDKRRNAKSPPPAHCSSTWRGAVIASRRRLGPTANAA